MSQVSNGTVFKNGSRIKEKGICYEVYVACEKSFTVLSAINDMVCFMLYAFMAGCGYCKSCYVQVKSHASTW